MKDTPLLGQDEILVSLLTGGGDKPYVFGLATELIRRELTFDLIGSDDLECPEFHGHPGVSFLNLRGDQNPDVSVFKKVTRVGAYYWKLFRYALTAKPKIFHLLWNNKIQIFDRTLLMLYYKALGKRIAFTVHNVNANKRDSNDTFWNRCTLRIQYGLSDHLFVHTEKMKEELNQEFGVPGDRVTVIPFGINNSVPDTDLTPENAKLRLGLKKDEKAILFFGNIAPYKGLEFLVAAFQSLLRRDPSCRLIVAGRPKNCEEYWQAIFHSIQSNVQAGQIILKAEYISDKDTEVYFKAADVLVLPYTHIYQSGVLFLGHSFGLPVIAADVGSLKEEIVEGETGYMFRVADAADLAAVIERYFASSMYRNLDRRRPQIRDHVEALHSWQEVGRLTLDVYSNLLKPLPLSRQG
jgi:glycosyltransferase involved in cell wall biosynthesis